MASHSYDTAFDSFAMYSAQPSSPSHLAANVGSPDINSLFEAFTNNGSYQSADEYSAVAMQHHHNHAAVGAAAMNMHQMTGSAQGPGLCPDGSSNPSAESSYLGYSGGEALQFAAGLRIHPAHYQQPPPPSSYYTEQPSAGTVSYLEEAAMQQSGPFQGNYHRQSQPSVPGRQSRRSTLSDGVNHIASLSLNSPRHSVSTGSTTSSSQSSPTTPISAYSLDSSASFANMQQQYSYQQMPNTLAQSAGPGKMPSQLQQQYHQQTANTLSASLPPSFGQQDPGFSMQSSFSQQQAPATANMPYQHHSQSRTTSSGLMDRIVSRQPVAPLDLAAGSSQPHHNITTQFPERKGSQRRTRSKSGLTSSPPLTPSRTSLRSSRGLATSQSTPQALGTPVAEKQTPSRGAPYRTPGKAPASGTPKRPDTLRRTASHTPHGTTPSKPALASPAPLDSFRALQPGGLSSLDSAQLRRVGSGLEFEFPVRPAGMARATSSPGWAFLPPPPSRSSDSGSSHTSGRSRRSSTVLSLQMSPVSGVGTPATLPLAVSPSVGSCQQALHALDYISAFLAEQAAELQANPQQIAALALGTYEQSHAVEDLKRRIQSRLSVRS